MIRYGKDMEKIEKIQMLGGHGKAQVTPWFKQDEYKAKLRLISTITLEPGCSVGEHNHFGEEEIIYIVTGKATYCDNGHIYELNPGDATLTLEGKSHAIKNNTNELLVYTAIIATLQTEN